MRSPDQSWHLPKRIAIFFSLEWVFIMEQHFSQPRRDKRFSFSIQKNQFHSEGEFMAALIDGITYAKKGWY